MPVALTDCETAATFHADMYLKHDAQMIKNRGGNSALIWLVAFVISLIFWPLLLITIPWMFILGYHLLIGERQALRSINGIYTGLCPNCHQEILVRHDLLALNCPVCTHRILREGSVFRKL